MPRALGQALSTRPLLISAFAGAILALGSGLYAAGDEFSTRTLNTLDPSTHVLNTADTPQTDPATALDAALKLIDGHLEPRKPWAKPTKFTLTPHDNPHVLYVKFRDGLDVTLHKGAIAEQPKKASDALASLRSPIRGRWERVHSVPPATLDDMRARAQVRLRRELADMNTEFHLYLETPRDASRILEALSGLDIVEYAAPTPRPVTPPLPPSFENSQGYLNAAPTGVGAKLAWTDLCRGAGVTIADIEYTYNAAHADLGAVTLIGPTPVDAGFGNDHGTAVLGVLVGADNTWGVTGIAPDSARRFAGTWNGSVWNVGGAVTSCAAALAPGDIILLEQQMAGPLAGENQFGLVPVEWWAPWYNAITTAVGSGRIVVLAAGNGSQNLDASTYRTGNGGHWPFTPERDSGAIYVGAGASAPGFLNSSTQRSRLWYSNYGSRLNLQGWGEGVWTIGYGDAYNAEGVNLRFTRDFGGTSSASPIVVGACALVQSLHKQRFGGDVLSCTEMRTLLAATGLPQQSGQYPASQKIGPFPDVAAAIASLVGDDLCRADWNDSGIVDGTDIFTFLDAWFASRGQSGPGLVPDFDNSQLVDEFDIFEFLDVWFEANGRAC